MDYLHFYFHPRVGEKAGKDFDPLFVSLHLCIFLTRLASLENNPAANQTNISLPVSAPTYMGEQGVSPTAAQSKL